MTQMTQEVSGNTRTSTEAVRSRNWVGTLNNWTEEEMTQLHKHFEAGKFIIGKEKGESGTEHLQFYVSWKNARSLKSMKKISERAHWEKAKGNIKQNFEYCSKEKNFVTNIENKGDKKPNIHARMRAKVLESYDDAKWHDWQKEILDIVDNAPQKRKIHWRWESDGGKGKTYLAKYLLTKYKTAIGEGKRNDVFNGVLDFMNANDEKPDIILLDIPRQNRKYISYSAIEKLKDGMFYSGKYEGGVVVYDDVHVIVFSNSEPDEEMMSEDRWDVKEICAEDRLSS